MRFAFPSHIQVMLQPQQYNHYSRLIPPGVSLETVMDAATFVHCRKSVRLYDMWTVIAQDGSYEADFRIVGLNAVSGEMKFRLLRHLVEEKAEPLVDVKGTAYKARWNAGKKQFEVVITATGEVAAEPFFNMDLAKAEAARLESNRTTQKAA